MKRIGHIPGLELVKPLLQEHQQDVWRVGYVGSHQNGLGQVVLNDHVVEKVVPNDQDSQVVQKLKNICSPLLLIMKLLEIKQGGIHKAGSD